MLSTEQIRKHAVETSSIPAEQYDIINGAIWANEQNAAELAAKDAEIAELVDALRMVAPIMQSKNWKGGSIEKAVTAVLAKYPE